MRLKRLIAGTIMAGTLAGAALPAFADELFVPLFSYRTGPFAGSGIPIANGMHDYLTMLNERDGGINGVKIRISECETGYDTQKGVECYEQVKGEGALVISPYSTGITLQVIPKASVDKIPVLSMAYGLSAAAEGNTFPWVFNPPNTYWDGASAIVTDIARRKAAQTLSRARRSVTSSLTPAMAASRSRFWSRWPTTWASSCCSTRFRARRCRTSRRSGSTSAATGLTT
jgi:branched-chain amino acid transport system substrate-binding protein